MQVIWAGREWEYFLTEDWTGGIGLIQFSKFVFRRTLGCAMVPTTNACA